MDAADKRMLEREALRNMIQQWNANRLDLFELSEPNENLEFHGVMRFYFQDSGQKIATKCIRVASDATVSDVIETLIEKFRPDMRMLSLGSYSLWETHGPDDERKLEPHEKPLLVQLNWHADDREGRFLLKCLTNNENQTFAVSEKSDQNFKRKLSKREKKEMKKKEKLSRLKSDANDDTAPVAEKLYTELPETMFTRSISNPEAVMRRRRHQKLERKLQQFRSKDGAPDTGGTLKIYGSSLCPDVPYKTILVSVNDTAGGVVREMLDKYGLHRHQPHMYCIVQVDTTDNSEYILEDDECPLAILMTHPHRSSIMFHVRRRPADSQPRRRKKKVGSWGSSGAGAALDPLLIEVAPDGSPIENGLRVRVNTAVEVGSGNGVALQLYGPSIQPRHCVIAPADGGGYTVTPLHADARVTLDQRRVTNNQHIQHGSLLKFGRISTFRFVDPAQENLLNRNMAHTQHYGSGSIYDRSPTSPGDNTSGAMSPTSMTSHQPDVTDPNANTTEEYPRTMSPVSHDAYNYRDGNDAPYNNNNTLKLDNESLMMSQHMNDSKEDYIREEQSGPQYNEQEQGSANRTTNSQYKDNYETTFDLEGNVETKSICSAKSGGSGHDNRMISSVARPGQEAILPAVLEFPEQAQAHFLNAVITRLDPHAPAFKLAPVYTLYLCARYRASTHYRPELSPTERAHKLTAFLHHVATLIHATVQERCTDSAAQAFWMANASELLHFLKCDRHISSFSTQAQDLLPTTVQNAFSNLVSCFQEELARALSTLNNPAVMDATEATAPTLQALAAAMVLLRRCRVNAALTIQLFSHLFHYINAVCFNKLVTEPGAVNSRWGGALSARLALLTAWAERQGLELAADCHLARTHQAARLIQGEYRTPDEVRAALEACFKLNSVQVAALLTPICAPEIVDAAVNKARALADELCRADGREVAVEESAWLGAALLVPGDGFSAEVVRGVPPGLAEFVAPLQRGGLCRLQHQPRAAGLWTVYMAGQRQPRAAPPAPAHLIQLHKNSNGMGLSIVAAKGAGQSKLGIYIKSVVPGGAAAADGRLAAGDQLLSVDGHSLVGITQEKAAEYLVRTGPTVTLEVAKQGAVLHGLATLLHQPAYTARQDEEVQYEDKFRRNSGTFTNMHPVFVKPASPLTELATAGYGRRPCHDRCQLLRDESTESSTEESDDCHPHYHGSIPRLIITLDQENNQLQDDMSPETPGYPLELSCHPAPPRPIPVFSFTCEDFDEIQKCNNHQKLTQVCQEVPPPIPEPPTNYDQSSESGETISLPPKMRPIDTKLTLDLFNSMNKEPNLYRKRCTGIDECISSCDCCRTPQPEAVQIPYIDEPESEPVIFENDNSDPKIATPKVRRILPSMSIDLSEESKPTTADAMCQTPCTPVDADTKDFVITETKPKQTLKQTNLTQINNSTNITPISNKKLELNLNIDKDKNKIDNIQCRLKRTLFTVSKSLSKSEETDPSTFTTSESCDESFYDKRFVKSPTTPLENCAKKVLDSVDRKSWKSPDEYRPAFGKVKALTKHFDSINLKYCVKAYKRNCQSSPNLSARAEKNYQVADTVPNSISLADIHYEYTKTDTSDTKGEKLTDDEAKSILIQLEDWSKFGSKGSEDTLAQGNEFELPNLPSEDHTDNNISNTGSLVFNEIVDKKPKRITLDNIRLKSNQSSFTSEVRSNSLLVRSGSLAKLPEDRLPRVVGMIPWREAVSPTAAQSCPDVRGGDVVSPRRSCPALLSQLSAGGGNLRRASERDLPARLAAEPVKPSKSVPALHHAPNNLPANVATGAVPISANNASWANKSRSSHNLAHDGFYQNVPSAIHSPPSINDRWSSLRSSNGSNRPQSAHFAAQPAHTEGPPDSPLHQTSQNHNAIMSARAAKLAEMSEEVTRRQQQLQYQQKSVLSHQHHNHQMYNSQPVLNQMISPTQQMLSPGQLSQSQHLNQNPQLMSPNQQMMSPGQQMMSPGQQMMSPSQQMMSLGQQIHNHSQAMINSNQSLNSNHQMMSPNQQLMNQNHMHVHSGTQSMYGASPQLPQHQHLPQNINAQQMYQNQNMPQRYEWSSAGPPPSPPRTQPPVAPKPQNIRRSELDMEEHQHLQQPLNVTIQPDDEHLAGAHNPWQREERERLLEQRRAAARQRRDAAIAQLISLGANRSPVQNQQLRALQLERDFERRATQHEQDEAPLETPTEEEDRISPTREKALPNPLPNPPKSILKTNRPDAVATNGYATDNQSEQSAVSELTSVMSSVSVSEVGQVGAGVGQVGVGQGGVGQGGVGPPPPPERGSSFAVMASRARALSPADNTHAAPPQSPMCRDKRVSFHGAPPPPAASPPREDPDRFIEEAESMLASPTTPTGTAPGSVTHTPGVIGAQEVYRDPRARRLAAAARAAPAEPPEPPEQLSFHDKMKMFALDAGAATPKDKVKISRAQRDIDAVH